MTVPVSKNITPDCLTGAVFAAEGLRNTVVLLNGPMGCKYYHSITSRFLMDRPPLFHPGTGEEVKDVLTGSFFSNMTQVPCTHLDQYDYVYGTAEKVEKALIQLRDNVAFDLLVVVNSPGASLIGDDIRSVCERVLPGRKTVYIESPGYSEGLPAGYENASLAILRELAPHMKTKKEGQTPSVNLLGLSIWHRYARGDREELTRLFELCGIRVNCCAFSGCTVEELCSLPQADMNIVIHADMALETASYLQETYGTPYYLCDGMPIGFAATEELFRNVCMHLRTDVTPLLQQSEENRGLVWFKLQQLYQAYGLPKGAFYAVEGTACEVLGYARFLTGYLGMKPDCLSVQTPSPVETAAAMEKFVRRNHAETAEMKELNDTMAQLVFGNANTIGALAVKKLRFAGIEISLPDMGYTDLIPKTHLGLQGALFLTEQVINGLMSRLG